MIWSINDIPDLTGKRAVITGITGGLGINTAIALGRHGATLVVTARDNAKAATAVGRIERESGVSGVEVVDLDLADLSQATNAARGVLAVKKPIDILINNAGVMATPQRLTVDGFELQMGTNHLGHFAWTATLWPLLASSKARIVSVSSNGHKTVRGIDLRSLTKQGTPRRYLRWRSYGESKLANLVFALELDRRAKAAGLDVVSVAAHPGLAATNLTASGPTLDGNSLLATAMHQVTKVIGQSAANGAWPLLMAATDPELRGGEYTGPGGPGQFRGRPRLVDMTKAAKDEQLADDLWAASVAATGIDFTV